MKLIAWIAWRELSQSPRAFALAILATAVAISICVATELSHRAREAAVSAQIDAAGASLVLIPPGKTSLDLARLDLGEHDLPARMAQDVGRDLSNWIRDMESRLTVQCEVDGKKASVIGVDPEATVTPFELLRGLRPGYAILGHDLATRLRKSAGDSVHLDHTQLVVAAVLPTTATSTDAAMFMTLPDLQVHANRPFGVNELRLFLHAGVTREGAERALRAYSHDASLISVDLSNNTRVEVHEGLREHRWVLYVLTAIVSAFCLLLWSNLNAEERRREIATLVAIGSSRATVFAILAARATIVAIVGGLLGILLAMSLILGREPSSALGSTGPGILLATSLAAATLLNVAGALPAALGSARRSHAQDLQA